MFERAEVPFRAGKKAHRALNGSQIPEVLLKFQQHRKYKQLLNDPSISTKNKQRIRKSHDKHHLFKRLRQDLHDKHKPEEAYEIWHQHSLAQYRSSRTDLAYNDEFLTKLLDEAQKTNSNEDSTNDPSSQKEEEKSQYIEAKFRKLMDFLDSSAPPDKQEFLIKTSGLEMFPGIKLTAAHYYHLANLNVFLHLCVLHKKWALGYKIVCIMVRFPDTDIKTIWPLAVEILRGKLAESGDIIFKAKEKRFFTWLSAFYSLSYTRPSRPHSAPMFKSGSMFQTPLYVIMSFWALLDNGEYDQVKDELETLILQRPYNKEGVFSFILALCYLLKNNDLTKKYEVVDLEEDIFNTKGDIFQKISKNFQLIEKHLETCKQLSFEYPDDIIDFQVKNILARIQRADRDEGDYEEDEYEIDEVEPEENLENLESLDSSPVKKGEKKLDFEFDFD